MPLLLALLAAIAGLGWFALAKARHWRQLRPEYELPPATQRNLRVAGTIALGVSLALCLANDHATMASLVFVMLLALAAAIVAMLLAYRPRWLAPLVAWSRRPP